MLTFLQPGWLALLLFLAPVILLHMRRRRTLVVGSVQIWRQVRSRATSQRSRRLPPFSWQLMLQLLGVILLALALSQPVWTAGASRPAHLVMVLDNSVAMLATGQADQASAALADTLTAGDFERVSVLLTSARSPVLLAEADPERTDSWRSLLPTSAGAGAADWQSVDQAVRTLISSEESVRLVVLAAPASDVPVNVGGIEPEVQFFSKPLPGPWLQDTNLRPSGDSFELSGRIQVPEGSSIRLELAFRAFADSDYLDWNASELDLAELSRDDSGLYRFTVPVDLPLSGVLRVRVAGEVPGPLTQVHHVLHVQPAQARVLLLGQADPQLVKALIAVPGVAVFTANAAEHVAAEDFDLVVSSGLPPQVDPAVSSLAFVTADEPLTSPVTTHWSADHRLSLGVNWAQLEPDRVARVPLLPGSAEVFSANGLPLVQARTVAGGRQVVVAFDPADSNWQDQVGYPAFISNVLHWVAPALVGGQTSSCVVLEPCELAAFQMESESGDIYEALQFGSTVLDHFYPPDAGVLWPVVGTVTAGEPLAVNAASVPTLKPVNTAAGTSSRPPHTLELWRYLVLLLLVVLVIEAVLQMVRWRIPLRGPSRRRHLQGMALRAATVVLTAAAALNPVLQLPASREQLVVLQGPNPASDAAAARLREQVHAAADNLHRGQNLVALEHDGLNLQAAVQLALAHLDPQMPGRVVLASSGMQATGDVRELLPELQARDVKLDVVPLQVLPEGEILVDEVSVARQVYAHDLVTLRAILTAETASQPILNVYRNGELLMTREQPLQAGANVVEIQISEPTAGEVLYEVEALSAEDMHAANNRNGLYLQVLPQARILVVARQTEWGLVFADALSLQGLDVTVVRSDQAPGGLDGWLAYQGIVFLDVPSIDLTVTQQEQLEQAVREHGRGLLILGGPNSFGPGGYYETVLERISPLSSRVPRDTPNVALAFVLDRSGSMDQVVDEGTTRLDIARQATITAAGLLHEESRVSVVVFDTQANVLVPLQPELDLAEIERALSLLEPGGGTAIYPGLTAAYEQLKGVDSAAIHVIVMSDGLSQPADFESLLGQMTAEGITVSVVAIGDGADVTSLERYARMGGGAFHATQDFRALPSILSQESMMLSGSPIEEGLVKPTWLSREQQFVQGLPPELPEIGGFVLTTAKDEATVHLQVHDAEGEEFPLLASWRYGNGHVLAFTSQAAGAWTSAWLNQPEFPLFWSQALRSFLPSSSHEGVNVLVHQKGSDLNLTVEVLDGVLQPVRGQEVTVNGVPLRETRSGNYQGTLRLGGSGTQQLLVAAGGEDLTLNHHVGYPARFDFSLAEPDTLVTLATATGGQLLTGAEPLFTGGYRVPVATALWRWLLLAGLILFLLELINRYDPALLRKEARS